MSKALEIAQRNLAEARERIERDRDRIAQSEAQAPAVADSEPPMDLPEPRARRSDVGSSVETRRLAAELQRTHAEKIRAVLLAALPGGMGASRIGTAIGAAYGPGHALTNVQVCRVMIVLMRQGYVEMRDVNNNPIRIENYKNVVSQTEKNLSGMTEQKYWAR